MRGEARHFGCSCRFQDLIPGDHHVTVSFSSSQGRGLSLSRFSWVGDDCLRFLCFLLLCSLHSPLTSKSFQLPNTHGHLFFPTSPARWPGGQAVFCSQAGIQPFSVACCQAERQALQSPVPPSHRGSELLPKEEPHRTGENPIFFSQCP